MQPVYLIKDHTSFQRKIMLDMAWLSTHKQIRLPKYYFEDGLYLPYKSNSQERIEKYYLSRDKIIKEDEHHYYFKFSFEPEEVEGIENS